MSNSHQITAADIILAGKAYYAPYNKDTALAATRGLTVTLPIFNTIGAVVVADADGLVLSVDPANNATLSLRATVAGMVNSGGVITLDTPRNVTITAAANESTKSLLVTGTDVYGEPLSESITGPNATTVGGKKAFKTITSLVATGDFGTITVGFGDVLGLPFRVANRNEVLVMFNGAVDNATVVLADDAAVTTTTGDIRGTIDPAGTLNGTSILSVIFLNPNRTSRQAAFGMNLA